MMRIRRPFLILLTFVMALAGGGAQTARVEAGTGNTWATTTTLPAGRGNPVAASAGGKIFLFGGACAGPRACTSIEAYDPGTGKWTSQGKLPAGSPGAATTGPDGRIYLSWWVTPGSGTRSPPGPAMLVYDPRTRKWTHEPLARGLGAPEALVTGRDGRIYAIGGRTGASWVGLLSALNLRTHRWTRLAPLPTPGGGFATAVGPNGRIYVIGGNDSASTAKLDRVDAYDPKTNTWSAVAPLPTPRSELQAVTGPDGRIYAIGGTGRCFTSPCNVVEAYDVRTNTWAAVANLPHPRFGFAAVLGSDNRIYVLGGYREITYPSPDAFVKTVDVYTTVPANQPLPAPPKRPTAVTIELAPMPTGRQNLGVVTGADGKIYAIGGQQVLLPGTAAKILGTVEAYDPKTNTWMAEPSLPAPRQSMGVATGPDGRIYVLGGVAIYSFPSNGYISGLRTVFIYDPTTHQWSKGSPMPEGRYQLAAVTGKDGRIYTIGGATQCRSDGLLSTKIVLRARPRLHPADLPFGGCAGTRTVRSFDPSTGVWKTLASLQTDRLAPAAAVGPDGRIYVFGGDTGQPDPRFEIYNPRSNHWSWGPKAPHFRVGGFAAATAADGRIDLIGGCLVQEVHRGGGTASCGPPSPVDGYNPRSKRWTTLGLTLNARSGLAAAAGPDGRVYAVGGQGVGNGRLLEVIKLPFASPTRPRPEHRRPPPPGSWRVPAPRQPGTPPRSAPPARPRASAPCVPGCLAPERRRWTPTRLRPLL